MKKIFYFPIMILSFIGLISCSESSENLDSPVANFSNPVRLLSVEQDGVTSITPDAIPEILLTSDSLTALQIDFLNELREEEKVARDLTEAFYIQFPTTLKWLSRMNRAENSQIRMITNVLDYFNASYLPLEPLGQFGNVDRQNKYNRLVNVTTEIEALVSCVELEEENLFKYKDVLPDTLLLDSANCNVSEIVILAIYRSSSNHIKAYFRQITKIDSLYDYTPKYLTEDELDTILSEDFQYGHAYNRHNHGNRNGKGKGSCDKSGNGKHGNGSCDESGKGNGKGNGKGGKHGH